MKLVNIYDYPKRQRLDELYGLLGERTPDQSISHQSMPSLVEHEAFVERRPYAAWYFLAASENYDNVFGTIYLTSNREIGIQIYRHHQGYGLGAKAMKLLMGIHSGPFYANINPSNAASIRFFEGFGFKHIQNTYRL